MRLGFAASALGSILQEKRLEVIANNLANAQTPGFKKDDVRFTDFLYQETHTRMDQGPIRITSSPLDVALVGPGWFKVKTDEGIFYTRSGNFMRDPEGRLVTPEGWPVLDESGGEIQINSTDITIDERGRVLENGVTVGTIAVVDFDEGVRLEKVRGGYFRTVGSDIREQEPEGTRIQQGALEEPNFHIVEEMTRMIDTLRMFEAYQKAMKLFHSEDTQLARKVSGR
ncbi:flagellar hook-basal body protein [Thermodesulforhabdus norvegica]|uniref:Flagellar basal-body rod protein FlgG n=1 Tax=Thermodesulforhabdus norvegica TaxID=39841 RepID=A0A1I4R4S3_9BACT|nr:flagellar hook basal-body protein [Thermodesulforhabdus norvegica]SFM47292.1 flagellar basal-body rod protein FlgG [Thermodesulforhabdus norvegica]